MAAGTETRTANRAWRQRSDSATGQAAVKPAEWRARPSSNVPLNASGRGRSVSAGGIAAQGTKRPPEIVKTWAFDSAGDRKYAMQIKKASNGNPCLMLVEGRLQEDGTYRKFNVTVWSEDFSAFFRMLDDIRAFMTRNDIKTPPGHRYDPAAARRLRQQRAALGSSDGPQQSETDPRSQTRNGAGIGRNARIRAKTGAGTGAGTGTGTRGAAPHDAARR